VLIDVFFGEIVEMSKTSGHLIDRRRIEVSSSRRKDGTNVVGGSQADLVCGGSILEFGE